MAYVLYFNCGHNYHISMHDKINRRGYAEQRRAKYCLEGGYDGSGLFDNRHTFSKSSWTLYKLLDLY